MLNSTPRLGKPAFFPDTDTFLGFWTLPMIAKLFASQENSDIETAVLHTGRHVDPRGNGGQFEAVQYHHVKQKWTRDKLHWLPVPVDRVENRCSNTPQSFHPFRSNIAFFLAHRFQVFILEKTKEFSWVSEFPYLFGGLVNCAWQELPRDVCSWADETTSWLCQRKSTLKWITYTS